MTFSIPSTSCLLKLPTVHLQTKPVIGEQINRCTTQTIVITIEDTGQKEHWKLRSEKATELLHFSPLCEKKTSRLKDGFYYLKKCIHKVNYKNAVNIEQGMYGQRDVFENLTGRLTSSAMSSLKLRGLGLAL